MKCPKLIFYLLSNLVSSGILKHFQAFRHLDWLFIRVFIVVGHGRARIRNIFGSPVPRNFLPHWRFVLVTFFITFMFLVSFLRFRGLLFNFSPPSLSLVNPAPTFEIRLTKEEEVKELLP
jgi:hypothetical protein